MVYGLWSMVYGLWSMVYGLWSRVYGLDGGFVPQRSPRPPPHRTYPAPQQPQIDTIKTQSTKTKHS
ncbi:hypothetical protein T484DRAFT_1948321 [Baffinella frigidus]|nr:hypothetical protein T484DRAFT_1948321 [Cryptophyta sp. CCMP2293]